LDAKYGPVGVDDNGAVPIQEAAGLVAAVDFGLEWPDSPAEIPVLPADAAQLVATHRRALELVDEARAARRFRHRIDWSRGIEATGDALGLLQLRDLVRLDAELGFAAGDPAALERGIARL